jgi:hypothetical protein
MREVMSDFATPGDAKNGGRRRIKPGGLTIRGLWAKSAGLCAFPGCRVYLLSETPKGRKSLNGHVAHIVAAEDNGPRADPSMEPAQRNGEPNLLLLCFKHHEQVDDYPDEFPVSSLLQMKSDHELWVSEQLRPPDVAGDIARRIYNGIVTSMIENLNVADWRNWSWRLTIDTPRITWDRVEGCQAFLQDVATSAWPNTDFEFETAARVLADEINAILEAFMEDGVPDRGNEFVIAVGDLRNLKKKDVDRAIRKQEDTWRAVSRNVHRATMAANWLADVFRDHYDREFLLRRLQIEDDNPVEFSKEDRRLLIEQYNPGVL